MLSTNEVKSLNLHKITKENHFKSLLSDFEYNVCEQIELVDGLELHELESINQRFLK